MSQDVITTLFENSISVEVKNEIAVMVASGKFKKLILKAAENFIDNRYSVSDTIDDTIEKAIAPFVGSVTADLPDNYFSVILDGVKEELEEILEEAGPRFIKEVFRDKLNQITSDIVEKLIEQKIGRAHV